MGGCLMRTKATWVSDLKPVLHEEGQPAFWNKRLEALRSRTTDPAGFS